MTAERVVRFSEPSGRFVREADAGAAIQELPTGNAAGEEFVHAVEACALAYAMSWSLAFARVRASQEGQEMLRRYGQGFSSITRNYSGGSHAASAPSDRPDVEIDWRARLHMDNTGESSYARAVAYVLNADPKLRRSYATFVAKRR